MYIFFQVLATIRFLTSGFFQHGCAEINGVSQSTISRIIERVVEVMYRLSLRDIVMPLTQAQRTSSMRHFAEIKGFPGVIGAIDGTHIAIKAPRNEHVYVNRKNFHSLNVQVICCTLMINIWVIYLEKKI